MPSTTSRKMRVRFSNGPPKSRRAAEGAEKLVEQIAVAMFDVDEVRADVGGDSCGSHVFLDQASDLGIGDDLRGRSLTLNFSVQHGWR